MARPPWTPTPEQMHLIEAANADFERAIASEASGWDKLQRAVAAGVPKDRLPEFVPHSRATVLRKLTRAELGKPLTNGRKHRTEAE